MTVVLAPSSPFAVTATIVSTVVDVTRSTCHSFPLFLAPRTHLPIRRRRPNRQDRHPSHHIHRCCARMLASTPVTAIAMMVGRAPSTASADLGRIAPIVANVTHTWQNPRHLRPPPRLLHPQMLTRGFHRRRRRRPCHRQPRRRHPMSASSSAPTQAMAIAMTAAPAPSSPFAATGRIAQIVARATRSTTRATHPRRTRLLHLLAHLVHPRSRL